MDFKYIGKKIERRELAKNVLKSFKGNIPPMTTIITTGRKVKYLNNESFIKKAKILSWPEFNLQY